MLAGRSAGLQDPDEDPSLFTRYGDRAVAVAGEQRRILVGILKARGPSGEHLGHPLVTVRIGGEDGEGQLAVAGEQHRAQNLDGHSALDEGLDVAVIADADAMAPATPQEQQADAGAQLQHGLAPGLAGQARVGAEPRHFDDVGTARHHHPHLRAQYVTAQVRGR